MVPQSVLNHALVLSICKEYRIMSADIFCRCDATVDQLIDVIEVSAFDEIFHRVVIVTAVIIFAILFIINYNYH